MTVSAYCRVTTPTPTVSLNSEDDDDGTQPTADGSEMKIKKPTFGIRSRMSAVSVVLSSIDYIHCKCAVMFSSGGAIKTTYRFSLKLARLYFSFTEDSEVTEFA